MCSIQAISLAAFTVIGAGLPQASDAFYTSAKCHDSVIPSGNQTWQLEIHSIHGGSIGKSPIKSDLPIFYIV